MLARVTLLSLATLGSVYTSPTSLSTRQDSRPPPYNQGQCGFNITLTLYNLGAQIYVTDLHMWDNSHKPISGDTSNWSNQVSVLENPLKIKTSGTTQDFTLGTDHWLSTQENTHTGAKCPGAPGEFPVDGNDPTIAFTCYYPCYWSGGNPSDPGVTWDGTKWNYPADYV